MTKPYPFTLIKEKLAALQDQAIDFAVGRHRLRLPPEIGGWVRANADLAMQPCTRADIAEFSAAASALLAREYRVSIAAENILPAPGGRAAMSTFVACALEPADPVFVTEPGYPAFARLARHRHARVFEVLLDGDAHFVPNFDDALDAASSDPRVIALNYPNNPTASTLTSDTVAAIRGAVGKSTIVFNDATYGPLVYGQERVSLLGDGVLDDADVPRVELHSFSKLFPLGPVALSFLAGSTEIMTKVSTYSEFAWSPPSKLQLAATKLCLEDADRMHELREFLPRRLKQLDAVLKQVGFRPFPACAGVYTLCRVPTSIAGQTVASAAEAAAVLIDRFDLAVVPWDKADQHYLRFSSMFEPDDLERLQALRDVIQLS